MRLGVIHVSLSSIFNNLGRCADTDIDVAPTVVGSHMSLLRPLVPRAPGERRNGKPGEVCFQTHVLLVFADNLPAM